MYLDQGQIQALYDDCHIRGNVNLFCGSWQKLYTLLAADRDWQPGELRAANRYIVDALKPQCPKRGGTISAEKLDCVNRCSWHPCHVKRAILE